MTTAPDARYARDRNDALRSELITAARHAERLVAEGENLLAAQRRFREEFRSRSFTAKIVHGLGTVSVDGEGRISIDLDSAKAALSDAARLGERILTALAEAEKARDEAASHGLPKWPDPGV
ncbi:MULTISPECIES: hypothetical protein [Actinomadura]|uniref:YbaB/EbfC family nucleoid-associated protein n=1 Tax=Actinomadura yumaensis TaxID=111807 RepID=A0ABW2C911_9ACTN|nr:hypothetical protein [Actinomadura sp. J1-007]MWK33967.1 hypothetical protein [Actinomadura sp. J1-007]